MLTTSIYPTALFDNLDEFLLEFEQHTGEIKAGIAVVGDAADYALVWEWGNRRQKKSGPRTVLGTNPEGKMVWLSSQAPFGYIRRNESEMWQVIEDELGKVKFSSSTAQGITLELEQAAKKISKKIAIIVQEAAPVDSGNLKRSIVPVDSDDVILDRDTDDYYGTLLLEEPEE